MGDPQIPADESPQKKAPIPGTVAVTELAKVVLAMNRFLSRFSAIKSFSGAQLSVADWTMLMLLLELKEARLPQLAWFSGIAEQRVIRIIEALEKAGLILSTESDDPERPKPILSLTDSGKTRLGALNETLRPVLMKALEGNVGCLSAVKNNLQPLMRINPP